jgi:subtilisin family serine protease
MRKSIALLALLAPALSLVLHAAVAPAFQGGDTAADIVVLTTTSSDVIYALDATNGHVYYADVPPRLPASIPLDSMTGLKLPSGVHVAAIAARRDRLIFVDVGSGRPALRELDPPSGAIYTLPAEQALVQPIAIAVSTAGDIAVADQGLRATMWLHEGQPTTVVPWPETMGRPVHLEFDGPNLLALDAASQRIVRLPAAAKSAPGAPTTQAADTLLPDLRAFSVFRGVYYLSNGSGLFAVAPHGSPRRVPCPACAAASVRATARRLLVFNGASHEISVMTRPVPIGMSIETSVADGQQALASFYAYLAERGFLAVREYVPTRAFSRVVDALRTARVILSEADGGDAPVPASLAAVLCRYNASACREPSAFANAPLAAGAPLTVPDYAVESFIRRDTVALHGTSVAALLQGVRALDPSAGRIENVQDLNAQSFETALARRGLTVASPARGDIVPGTFITLRDGAEQAGRDLSSACGVLLPTVERPTPIDIPDRVNHVAFKDFVPLGTNRDGSAKDLGVKDGDLYVMSFRRTKIQQLDAQPAADPGLAVRLAACMKRLADRPPAAPEPMLVVEALRVEGALYDFSDPPRRTAIEQPFYLAYRAVPVSAFANRSVAEALATPVTPAALKPGGPQDLLSRRTGTIDLPVVGWSLNALVPADDLERADSPLHAIERVPSGRILFLSREIVATSAASRREQSSDDQVQPLDQAIVELMKRERDGLLQAIDFHDLARESRAPVRVAMGEANVDLDHPAMAEERGGKLVSAFWTQSSPDQPFVQHEIAAPVASNPHKRPFAKDADHGVHVAGLLGARESTLLPGLLPHAQLYVIDTSNINPSELHQSIVQAATQGVKVFNLSLDFDRFAPEVANDIRVDFKNTFGRQLFVVAAGDGGLDLSDHQIPPIGWMHDVRSHMIGVGMSTHDGKNYEREAPDPDKGPDATMSVSNVGREYIQLAAPGEGIFSLGSKNAYTNATGTSQAAPQVAAAAAMLSQYSANQIKARLIYTATWLDTKGYIWGGRLNIRRAVWYPSRNLYVGKSDTNGPPVSAEFDPLMKITIGGERKMTEPDGTIAIAPDTLPFADVLRLTTLANGLYRVHFIDRANANRLRIIDEAEVHGIARFTFKSAARWDPGVNEFVDFDPSDDGRDISEFMYDYVARVPDVCEFQTSGTCDPTIIF